MHIQVDGIIPIITKIKRDNGLAGFGNLDERVIVMMDNKQLGQYGIPQKAMAGLHIDWKYAFKYLRLATSKSLR